MLSQDEVNDHIYSIGSAIPIRCFQIVPSIVFGIAMLSAIARSAMRFLTHRPLYWDDLILAFGATSFIAATVLLFVNTRYYYLAYAIQQDTTLIFDLLSDDFSYLASKFPDQWNAMSAVIWTTIFCVKASFLIISKQLLHRLPWLNIYFWFVVGFTFVSWGLVLASPFIPCPVTGYARACDDPSKTSLEVGFSALVTGLDVLTDIMVASVPLVIIARSKLDTKQKFIVGPFLCLSLVMIVFSILRAIKSHDITHTDFAWIALWQYIEAGVAIIVTSITTIRTVFTGHKQRSNKLTPSYGFSSDSSRCKSRQQGAIASSAEEESYAMAINEPPQIVVQNSWRVSYAQDDQREQGHQRKSDASSGDVSWPSEPTTFFRW